MLRFDREVQAEDRRDNYAMLSRLFRYEIDEDLLGDLIQSSAVGLTGNGLFDAGYARLRAYLNALEDIGRGRSELAIDYSLCFLGYGVSPEKANAAGPNAAYPYESFYRTGSKTLGGDQCAEVVAVYRAHAFKPQKERIIAEDHVACELEFMQFLASSELASLRAGDDAAAKKACEDALAFLNKHLLAWTASFDEAVGRFAETDFYRGLLEMTRGWLEMDAAYLREVIAQGKGGVQ